MSSPTTQKIDYMYATFAKFLKKYFKKHTLFKHGFNLSPMYKRSTGKIYDCSEDLMNVKIKIPLSYKNKNYVGSIFGGSLTSATDPIYMIQLMQILGENYVVWDKASTIKFKRPAKETVYSEFNFTAYEIDKIKEDVLLNNEIDITKDLLITNKDKTVVFAELVKTIYIADKQFYKHKRKQKQINN